MVTGHRQQLCQSTKAKEMRMTGNYKEISLLSIPDKVHSKTQTERMPEITDDKISE